MARGADHHQRLAGDHLGFDLARRFAKRQNGQIEPSAANLVEEVRGAALEKPHLDPGMLDVKRRQKRGQVQKGGQALDRPDRELSPLQAVQRRHRLARVLDRIERDPGLVTKEPARRGQPHLPGGADKKLRAQFVLERTGPSSTGPTERY